MSDPYLGQILIFAGSYEPKGWAFCDGRSLPISQNAALFSILGTSYGGDGQYSFHLPDLRGRAAVGFGQASGLSNYGLGQTSGQETVSLTVAQMPQHTHAVNVDQSNGAALSPGNGNLAQTASGSGKSATTMNTYTTGSPAAPATLNPSTIQPQGGNQPHSNIQPVLAINYIIALQGIFPSRS